MTYDDMTDQELASELGKLFHKVHKPDFATAVRRKPDNLAYEPAAPDLPAPPATQAWDWRTRNILGPAKFQGGCQSCASFALSSAIEAGLRIANPADTRTVDAGFLHTCVAHNAQLTEPDNCNWGADLSPTVKALVAKGYAFATPASQYPFPVNSCPTVQVNALAGATSIPGPNVAKAQILRAPIVSEMYVWSDFKAQIGIDIYRPDITSGGPYAHCVCVIGFSAVGWIIKNSLGARWGVQNGTGTIPYGSCGLFSPPPAGVPSTDNFAIQV